MKAAFYESTGPAAEVLKTGDVPDPTPGPGEVLVRVAVHGVNPTDCKRRARATTRVDASPPLGLDGPADEGADLVVMGTHARKGLGHMFLGSVAERVLRLAPCAVAAVPPAA